MEQSHMDQVDNSFAGGFPATHQWPFNVSILQYQDDLEETSCMKTRFLTELRGYSCDSI